MNEHNEFTHDCGCCPPEDKPRYLHIVIEQPDGLNRVAVFTGFINDIPLYEFTAGEPSSKQNAVIAAQKFNELWPKFMAVTEKKNKGEKL